MPFKFTNPNPANILVGDCVIRAISLVAGKDWESTYLDLALQGFSMHEMHSERMYRDGMSSDGRRGRDADNDGRYSETGSSYRRGRDARGRYTSRDYRYSRAEAKDRMIEKLEKMMNETTSAKDREIIKDCIEDLEA